MSLPALNRQLLGTHRFPADLTRPTYGKLPERVLQFGEGAFLRGFVDWMIDAMNRGSLFNGSVVVVKPRGGAKVVKTFNDQDGLFTLLLRGLRDGKVVQDCHLVGSISRAIDPVESWNEVLAVARSESLRFVVSNTTETGIACSDADDRDARPPVSFPAKLTAVLHERWKHFSGAADKGLIVLPCELIENNGTTLRECVLTTAHKWSLAPDFSDWVNRHCAFANTLVDRIVSGRPEQEMAKLEAELGYTDQLLIAGEPYHAFVIEAPAWIEPKLPFLDIGLNVTWTKDVAPYRDRKVRLLNGPHTMLTPVALLAKDLVVRQSLADPDIGRFVRRGLLDEILPTVKGDAADNRAFAESVLDRFANPFVNHRLIDIAMNSTSKFAVRLLPVMKDSLAMTGVLPQHLVFGLAALLRVYTAQLAPTESTGGIHDEADYLIRDDAAKIATMHKAWGMHRGDYPQIASILLSAKHLWGTDMSRVDGLVKAVSSQLEAIDRLGVRGALKQL